RPNVFVRFTLTPVLPGRCKRLNVRFAMNKVAAVLLAALLSGCSSPDLPPPRHPVKPGQCLVLGVTSGGSEVMIRRVHDGEILWIKDNQLGHEASVAPGSHKIAVTCTTHASWGTRTVEAEVQVEVEPGYTYYLTTGPINDFKTKPRIDVTRKPVQ